MTELILILNITLAIYTCRKFPGGAPNAIASIYISLCLLSFYTINAFSLTKEMLFFTAMPIVDYSYIELEVYLTYTLINTLSVFCGFGIKKINSNNEGRDFLDVIKKLRGISYGKINSTAFIVVLLALNSFNMLHLLSLDVDVLLSNRSYLTIKTPEAIGIDNPIFRIYHFLFRFTGAAMVIVLCESIYRRNYAVTLLSASYVFYCALLLAAGASRWLAVYCALSLIFIAVKKPKNAKIIATPLVILTFFSFMFVLMGRSNGHYGILHLGEYLNKFNYQFAAAYTSGVFVNIFEGVFNLANSIILNPNFGSWYKTHSILPMFSFMDGFSGRIEYLGAKFAPHVPMSAISESYTFGVGYFVAYLGIYFSFLRLSTKVFMQYESFVGKMVLMAPTYYILLAQHTYSMRTIIKPIFFLSIIFCFILLRLRKNKGNTVHRQWR